jgi:predicted metal-dependent hydrolase
MKWAMKDCLTPNARLKLRLDGWSVRLRVMPRLVRVQKMKRKWGSCSTAGTVTLAADLDKQETRFQDFVIVHELLHLKIPNHGRLFKALMSTHVPNWRELDVQRKSNTLVKRG